MENKPYEERRPEKSSLVKKLVLAGLIAVGNLGIGCITYEEGYGYYGYSGSSFYSPPVHHGSHYGVHYGGPHGGPVHHGGRFR